jgi:hypothetical protein
VVGCLDADLEAIATQHGSQLSDQLLAGVGRTPHHSRQIKGQP